MSTYSASSLQIRPVHSADLGALSSLWYDRAAVLAQMGLLRLSADAEQRWQVCAQSWLDESAVFFWIALIDALPVAALCVAREVDRDDIPPLRVARVLDLVVDLHAPQAQQGVVRALVKALCEQLKVQGIGELWVEASALLPVEQAFWRGLGARREAQLLKVIL